MQCISGTHSLIGSVVMSQTVFVAIVISLNTSNNFYEHES